MGKKTTTVSMTGTKEDVLKLRIYAIEKGVTVGDLVRSALVAHYPFFASDGKQKCQTEKSHTK